MYSVPFAVANGQHSTVVTETGKPKRQLSADHLLPRTVLNIVAPFNRVNVTNCSPPRRRARTEVAQRVEPRTDVILSKSMNHYVEIRQATETDAANITAVINRAFGKAEHFFVEGDRITVEEVLDSLHSGAFIVAESDGEMVGCVYVEPRGERAYLGLLSVNPEQQQRGVGLRLMRAGEELCAGAGCRFMDIKIVNLRTELPGYYRKFGYIETGSSPFPAEVETKVPCYFIDMSKRLSR